MITAEQKDRRRLSLGSSDIAAVLGVDDFNTAANVWLSKRGMVEDFKGNDLTDRGIRLEPVLIDFAEHRTGKQFRRDVMVVHESGLLHTNFDGIEDGDSPEHSVEAKSTVILEGWEDEGTDFIPQKVIAQAHHGFACVPSLRVCHVPVLLPGYKSLDFRLYEVARCEELVELVIAKGIEFMGMVQRGIQPEIFEPTTEVLKRMRRTPEKIIDIPDFLGQEFEESRDAELAAGKLKKETERKILAVMLDGDAIRYAGKVIEYREISRDGYTVEASTYRRWMFPRAGKAIKQESVGVS